MWGISQNVFGSIFFLEIAVFVATRVDLISLPGKDKVVDGCVLENITPAGFQMCQKLCKRRKECCLINFNVDQLTCSLLSSPCSENSAKIENKKGYIYDFLAQDDNRTMTSSNTCQFAKCFSLSAGPEICLNHTTPRDCNANETIQKDNQEVHTICPHQCSRYKVQCSFYQGHQWTVIQKRFNGSQDFYKSWDEYKHGFGIASGEYWIGNQALFELTSTARYELLFILTTFEGHQYHARYSTFYVGNETSNFRLTIGGYSGNAGDSMAYHNGMQFSTYDSDNDNDVIKCAVNYRGGWWYNTCFSSNLNGAYYTMKHVSATSMCWYLIDNTFSSLKSSTMMIRRL